MIKYVWIIILSLLYLRALLDCIGSIIELYKLPIKKGRRWDFFWLTLSPLTIVTLSGTTVIILFYSFSSWLGSF